MYTNVSFYVGDDEHLVDLLRVLAVRKGKKVGELVRDAIFQVHGDEIDALRPIFFVGNGDLTHSPDTSRPHKQSKQS